MLRGLITALITPFRGGRIDFTALNKLIERQINAGVKGLLIAGTTGEAFALDDSEREALIKFTTKQVNSRIPVIVGTGSNCTAQTIKWSQSAKDLGANYIMVVTPYYNKPTQEGIYQHFRAVHEAVDIPIIIYNNPSRAMVDITEDTIAKLLTLKRVIAIKDSTGNLTNPLVYQNQLYKLKRDNFSILSGDDISTIPYYSHGGVGTVSVTANLLPNSVNLLDEFLRSGRYEDARNLQLSLVDTHRILFCESNPVPIKYALSCAGIIEEGVRLPLVLLSEVNKIKVKQAISQYLKKHAGIEEDIDLNYYIT